MNYEEAVRILKGEIDFATDFSWRCEAFEIAISSLDRAEKYKWHDLRKNPKDLPKPEDESVFYECVLRGSCNAPYYPNFQFFDGEWGMWEDMLNPFSVSFDKRAFAPIGDTFGEVIAWREKEPFEEEEND